MKALIDDQVKKLERIDPIIIKQSMLNGNTDKVEIKQINWEKELKIFENIDINKPIFRGMYALRKTTSDTTIVHCYEKTKNSKSQIAYVSVAYSISKKLISIEAMQKLSNPVFNSENKYLMRFDTSSQLLNFYELHGWQGFRFGKNDIFLLEAKIF